MALAGAEYMRRSRECFVPSIRLISVLRIRMMPPPQENSTSSPASRQASTWIVLPFVRWITSAPRRGRGRRRDHEPDPPLPAPSLSRAPPSSGDALVGSQKMIGSR